MAGKPENRLHGSKVDPAHDLLGYTLTAITVKLDLARRVLSHDADRARNEIVEAEQTVRNALGEVREAVSGFHGRGLNAEISRARRSLLAAEVKLTITFTPVDLTSNQVTVVCLALREAVTNIIRHAHASKCHVQPLEKHGAIHFIIEDNGLGGPIREGNGLRGMRERVRSIAGTVKLTGSGSEMSVFRSADTVPFLSFVTSERPFTSGLKSTLIILLSTRSSLDSAKISPRNSVWDVLSLRHK